MLSSKTLVVLCFFSFHLFGATPEGTCHSLLNRCFANSPKKTGLDQSIDVYLKVWGELGSNVTPETLRAIAKGDPFSMDPNNGELSPTLKQTLEHLKQMALESGVTEKELKERASKALLELAEGKISTEKKAEKEGEQTVRSMIIALKEHANEFYWSPLGRYLVGLKFGAKTNAAGLASKELMAVVDRYGNQITHSFGLGAISGFLPLDEQSLIFRTSAGIFRVKITDDSDRLIKQPNPELLVPRKMLSKATLEDEGSGKLSWLSDRTKIRVDFEWDAILMDEKGLNRQSIQAFAHNYPFAFPAVTDSSQGLLYVAALDPKQLNRINFRQINQNSDSTDFSIDVSKLTNDDGSVGILHSLTLSDVPGKLIGLYTNSYTRPSQRPFLIEFDIKTRKAKLKSISGPLGLTEKKDTAYGDEIAHPIPLKDGVRFLFRRKLNYFILNAQTGVSESFPLVPRLKKTEAGKELLARGPRAPEILIRPYEDIFSVLWSDQQQQLISPFSLESLMSPTRP